MVGGVNKKLIKRKGHFRVYLDKSQKDYVDSIKGTDIDGKILGDLEKELEPKIQEEYKGIKRFFSK